MILYTLADIIAIAEHGEMNEWESATQFIKQYQGDDDVILGLKWFMEQHGYNRSVLLAYQNKIKSLKPLPVSNKPSTKMPVWITIAAAVIVLFTGVILNFIVQKKSVNFAEVALPIYLSDDQDLNLSKAMSLYKKGEYHIAAELFNKSFSDTAIYYEAVCHQLNQNFVLSIQKLNQIPEYSEYHNKAQIRLASNYIYLYQNEKALDILSKLNPHNFEEAQKIKALKLQLE
ncbi:MAG: hypothetical protein MUC81_11605 [Bacteroidia bacterium]|jgi:hypothetical protein|nr:hypothetical protein [Bacteroidia bacterium]